MDFLYIFYFLNHIRGDFNKSVGSNIRNKEIISIFYYFS